MVNIKGIKKHIVLYALWNASHVQGLSFLGLNPNGFTLERAEELVNERYRNAFKREFNVEEIDESEFNRWKKDNPKVDMYFDYVDGHVIKCNIGGDTFDERLFDRDCGDGAAVSAIESIDKL